MGAKPAKLCACLLCSVYSMKELLRPSVQERALLLTSLSLCMAAACTSESSERAESCA